MNNTRNENEKNLTERENRIELLSESVAKLQTDVAYNIEEIRAISTEKNNLTDHLNHLYC